MKLSSKIQRCGLSPMRQFYPREMAARARGVRIHHLNIGQPDVETPQAFFNAVRDFDAPVVAYPPAPGEERYVEALRTYYAGLGCSLEREDILATFGGSEALEIAMACILDEGDEVLVPEPFYPNYTTFINVTGGRLRPIPTPPEEGYRFASRERIEPLINRRTRAILVATPGNPTGVVLSEEEMRLLADIARERDLFLISDEVYREVVYTGEKATMLALSGAEENVVIIDSVSKRFSTTGARVGALISRNRELMAQALKWAQGRLCITALDQAGAARMYETLGEDYFSSVREEYRIRTEAAAAALEKIPGVRFTSPQGAFYLMAALPVDDTEKLQYFLLDEFQDRGETMMYAPGAGFYAEPEQGRDKIRLACVKNAAKLTRAIELLGLGIAAYHRKNGN